MERMTLKPCPFCGGKAVTWETNYTVFIECGNYAADKHRILVSAETHEKASKLWNMRRNEEMEDR